MKLHLPVRLLPVFLGVVLLGQGCLGSAQPARGPDGGVFKTTDRGVTWVQKKVLIEGTKGVSIAEDVITAMAFDPQDRNTVYAGTELRGLIMSLDGGDSWQPSKGLNKGRIEAVAVDAKDKCSVYATQRNRIYKTENCGRDWAQIWFDPKTDKVLTQIAVDWFNPTIVYAGTSEGDILKSTDAGRTWLVSKRADAPVTGIVLDTRDSRTVYVATRGDGIWKTLDGGKTWLSIEKQLSEFDNARRVTQVALDALKPSTVYLVSRFGILKSENGGDTWAALQVPSQANSVEIRRLAVNPRNGKELQYITAGALVLSSDGGITWNAKQLPSTRPANAFIVDSEQGNTLYLGIGAPIKN